MTIRGYARVSTTDQHFDGQIAQLKAAGATRVYREKVSGATRQRPQLKKLLRELERGDVVLVTRLDRLARSTLDMLTIITKEVAGNGANFRSLHEAWADSTTMHGKLLLTMMSGIAEFERELIKARTQEGMQRARARGVKFGRRSALTRFQAAEALERLENGESTREIARSYNVSAMTISRLKATMQFREP
jgi:DNA invertase Pin-like site-specific DNA recombinase